MCFADTRGSQVEIVQNIGRALRLNKDGSTKIARIIVPVFLEPNEDPTDMVASASFRPLVAVLQGLRSHDERLVEQLASRALTSGKRKVHVQRDEDGRIVGARGESDGENQEQDDTDAAAESALLHFSSPRDAATIAAFLRTRVYRPESLVWLEGYQGAAGVPARSGGPLAVGGTGRAAGGAARAQRRDHGRRRGGAGDREAGRMDFEHQIEAGQAHPGAAGRPRGAGSGLGVTDTVYPATASWPAS